MSNDLEKNKSWCPIPWVTYSINSLGQYRLCVQANSYKPEKNQWKLEKNVGKFTRGTLWQTNDPNDVNNKPLHCTDTSLTQLRNNPFLKEVRAYMLRGERHPYCKRCNKEDDNGVLSRRMSHRKLHEHDDFTIDRALEYTSADGTITDLSAVPLLAADIRLGNLCNQKCRMCYPGESSAWYQEWVDTFQTRHTLYYGKPSVTPAKFTGPGNTKITLDLNDNDKAVITEYKILDNEDSTKANTIIHETTDPYAWVDSNSLYKKLSADSPQVKHIHMSGGEPLMITEHYEFLQGYVDSGQSKYITLNYNTNLSNIPQRALELWKHFGKIELRVSIDAFGKLNEFIRSPSNWEIVLRNLRLLTDARKTKEVNLSLETITTVQIYNIFYLDELVSGLQQQQDIEIDSMHVHMLHDPQYLNITSLPAKVKDIITDKIKEIPRKYLLWEKETQGILNHMYSADTSNTLTQFFSENSIMDKYRGQSTEFVMPEIFHLIKNHM